LAQISPATSAGSSKPFEQVEEQLLAVSLADEIHFRTLQFDQCSVQTCKDASEGQLDLRVGGTNLTGQHLRVGIAGGTEKTEADQGRLLSIDFLDDHLVRRVGVRLIEHHTLVAGLFQYRREGHDADGRKAHDPDTAVFRACFRRECVELWVTNVDEKYPHGATVTRIQWQEKGNYLSPKEGKPNRAEPNRMQKNYFCTHALR
jgi:hypothetical protein